MLFGPQLSFPGRIMDKEKKLFGKSDVRFDELISIDLEMRRRKGKRIAAGKSEKPSEAFYRMALLGYCIMSLISEMCDPLAYGMSVESRSLPLSAKRKKSGFEITLPIDDQIILSMMKGFYKI